MKDSESISSLQAGKFVCKLSDWQVSNLQLQKILYIANMFYLGEHHKRMINEDFEAWDYGPVLPILYHRVKIYGASAIKNIFHDISDIESPTVKKSLSDTYDKLSKYEAARLGAITHREGGGWDKNYQSCCSVIIPNKDILSEYIELGNK